MRFVFAIIAFVVATALIGVGVAQRTFLLPPGSVSAAAETASDQQYVLLDSAALRAHPGSQTVSLSGDSTVFVAYGREADVAAWLDGSSYAQLAVDDESGKLTEAIVPADKAGAENVASGSANPAGSDLWLEEYTGDKSLTRTINVPEGYSAIIASDGTKPAPAGITVSWPIDNSTPWAVPLLLTGSFVLLVGLALLLWGLWHMRRQQGPRRKPPAGTPRRRFSAARTNAIESGMSKRRKAITRSLTAVVPVLLVGSLGLGMPMTAHASTVTPTPTPASTTDSTGTPTPTATPAGSDSPTPTPTATGAAPDAVLPAVTQDQVKTIVGRVIAVESAANAAFDCSGLPARFDGPALQLRTAAYAIHAGKADYALPAAVPTGNISVVLPQATTVWPKSVFAVIENEDKTVAPLAVTMVQDSARANYKVRYAISLEPDTTLPPVAAATVGTSRLAPDTKLLSMTPSALATAYADILLNGSSSSSYNLIDTSSDTLLPLVGADYKAAQKTGLADKATVDFAEVPGATNSIALSTNDSGALVSLTLSEAVTVKAIQAGATVKTEGAVQALSGVAETDKGMQSTYDYQLLFYIPSAGETGKPTLLGFSQGLVQAKELP